MTINHEDFVSPPKITKELDSREKAELEKNLDGKLTQSQIELFVGNAAHVEKETVSQILNNTTEQNISWLERINGGSQDKYLLTLLRLITGQTGDFSK